MLSACIQHKPSFIMPLTNQLFDSFSTLNVLIVGDIMIDRYLTGIISRISPEAPVPVLRIQHREDRLGGAANVALNIKALGATPYLYSVIGQDQETPAFLDMLLGHGISVEGVLRDPNRVTTVKTRAIGQHQHLLRIDREDTHGLNEKISAQLLADIRRLLDTERIDVILFQDYNKGVLTVQVIQKIVAEALLRGIATVVDPKFDHFWAYQHVTLFKPNLKEIQQQVNFPVTAKLASLQRAARHIRANLGNTYTLITLSEQGLFIDRLGQGVVLPTYARSVVDVCGAGDTVASTVALMLALDRTPTEIGALANLAGGQVCGKQGVVPVDLPQLKREYGLLTNGPEAVRVPCRPAQLAN